MRLAAATAVLGCVGCLLLLSSGIAQVKIPPDLTFPLGKDSPGVVTFSHEFHKDRIDKCTECHIKIFKLKKGTSGEITMEKIKAGQFCGNCHNGTKEVGGKVVFLAVDEANCARCHKK